MTGGKWKIEDRKWKMEDRRGKRDVGRETRDERRETRDEGRGMIVKGTCNWFRIAVTKKFNAS
jgi:hypothetical protein